MGRFLMSLFFLLIFFGAGNLSAQEMMILKRFGISFDAAAKSLSIQNISIDPYCPSESFKRTRAVPVGPSSCLFNVEIRQINF